MGYSAYLLRVQDVVLQSYLSRTVYQELSIEAKEYYRTIYRGQGENYLPRARSTTELSIKNCLSRTIYQDLSIEGKEFYRGIYRGQGVPTSFVAVRLYHCANVQGHLNL
jgi:hypothetical protein